MASAGLAAFPFPLVLPVAMHFISVAHDRPVEKICFTKNGDFDCCAFHLALGGLAVMVM